MDRVRSMLVRWVEIFRKDERGITGLETAIVLIAFIVVAAVFAFAVLQTGLFSSEKTKETAQQALSEVSSTLNIRGAVTITGDGTSVGTIKFSVTNAVGAEPVNVALESTLVRFVDPLNDITIRGDITTGGIVWSREWLTGAGPNIDSDEQVTFTVNVIGLATTGDGALGANTRFTLTIFPPGGAEVFITRRTPLEIKTGVMELP